MARSRTEERKELPDTMRILLLEGEFDGLEEVVETIKGWGWKIMGGIISVLALLALNLIVMLLAGGR